MPESVRGLIGSQRLFEVRVRSTSRRASGVVALALATYAMSGCSSAGSITCQDFGSRSSTDQSSLVRELIGAHGLDWTSNPVATAKIEISIEEYCGVDGIQAMAGQKANATQNLNSSIDHAINWDDYKS